MVSLLVCLIPTTIGALLSAIGIAGMDRLVQRNVLAMSRPRGRGRRRRQHAAARQDRHHHARQPAGRRSSSRVTGVTADALADAAQLSSLADETPEGRSIVVFAKQEYGLRERTPGELARRDLGASSPPRPGCPASTWRDGHQLRKGAASAVAEWVREQGGDVPTELGHIVDGISAAGGTPLVVGEVLRRHGAACSASSTSRTSSSRACGSGSTRCAGWASAP